MKFKKGILPNVIFGLLLLFEYIRSQITDLSLGIEEKHLADLQKFFKLDTTQSQHHQNLIFHVSPLDNYENWSDPDIYISKNNHYPSAYYNDYSSARVGDDIIIIPTNELKNVTQLYVGVTCGKRCEFKVKAYYEDTEITIQNKQELFFFFDNKTFGADAILKFYPDKDKFYEVYAFSPKLKDFELSVTLHKKNSKQNILLQNTWTTGYSAFLEPEYLKDASNDTLDYYYRFVISSVPESHVLIGVKESFINEDFILKKNFMGSILPDKHSCFSFNKVNFTKEDVEKNTDKIIFSASSFMEDVKMVILDDYQNLQKNVNDGRTEFNFNDELIIRLNFTQILNKYLCIQSSLNKFISYRLFAYKESEVEDIQGMNFLINGLSKNGYLPGGKVTSYITYDNSLNATSLSLNLIVKEGNPILYGYVCINKYDCFFTSKNFDNFKPNLISTTKLNDQYTISIPREDNICYKLKEENHPSYKFCFIMSVVKCEGNTECSFLISMHYNDRNYLLKERIKHTKYIKAGTYDYYQISNKDTKSNKIGIILHSHTGDADLFVSRTHKDPMEDPKVISSSTTLGNRDHIEIFDTINDSKSPNYQSSLVGDYYVAVKGFQNSFYSIFFFTDFDQNPTKAYNYIDSGLMHLDVSIPNNFNIFRLPNPEQKSKKPFIISAYSLNCIGNLTVSRDNNDPEVDGKILSSPINYKTSHNQIIVNPDSEFYDTKLFLANYRVFDDNQISSNEKTEIGKTKSCLFYICANPLGSELMLNEGIPHVFTLNSLENLNYYNYVYPHIYKNKNPCLLDIYFENKFDLLHVLISFNSINDNKDKNSTVSTNTKETYKYELYSPENIIIKSSTLEKNCHNLFSCNIHIQLNYNATATINSKNRSLTYKITARSNSLIPVFLKKGEIKESSVIPNNYQYYYSDVNQNEEGEIFLKSKSGSGILVGKIIKKNSAKEPNSDYNNIVLPTILNSNMRFNKLTNSLYFTKEDTKICEETGCDIYFGVYSENKENFQDSLNEFSILLTTGNIKLKFNEQFYGSFDTQDTKTIQELRVNPSAKIQYFIVEAEENQYSAINISVMFQPDFKGKLLVNVLEPKDTIRLPTLEQNLYFISENECTNCKFEYTLNKQPKKFIIGVYTDILKYSNSTAHVDYQIYASDISYINAKNIYEIKLGQSINCVTRTKNQYCDILVNLPDTDTILFYTQFLKEFYSNYEEHFMDSFILANIYNASDYLKLKENEEYRPRLDNNPMYISGKESDATREFSIIPDNKLLIIKNPYNKNIGENKNFNFNQTILFVSIYLENPSTFRFLSNKFYTSTPILNLNHNHYYLLMVTNMESLHTKFNNINRRYLQENNILTSNQNNSNIVLQKADASHFVFNINSVAGEGSVLFENKFYQMNQQTKNFKIVFKNSDTSKDITLNTNNNNENTKAIPFICIVNVKISLFKTDLVLGESFNILYPSLLYPKDFYFMVDNNTYASIENDIDVTFNFKVLEYKENRASLTLEKNDKFKLKSHINENVLSLKKVPLGNLNLGEYDTIHKVGMITAKLDKEKSYIINYDIHLESEKSSEELLTISELSRGNDKLLMQVVFTSDNFKYTKAILPYKTYYYSSINTKQIEDSSKKETKIYHIHRLSRNNLNENFFYIELGSCGNEFSYSLRDYNKFNDIKDEDFFVNKTNLKHEYRFHYGKKIIEVELSDNTRDLLIIVFPLKSFNKLLCQEIEKEKVCETTYYSDYVIRYRTSKSRIDMEKYLIDREGLVTLKYIDADNPMNLNINWGPILEKNDSYVYNAIAESKMIIRFYDAKKIDASHLNSICYFDNSNALVEHVEMNDYNRIYSYNYKLTKTVDYHISIIAETLKDNTYLVYTPTYVYIKIGGYSVILIVLLVFLIILLLFVMFFIYRKYRLTKKRLDYEINDIRNFASIPRDISIDSEQSSINKGSNLDHNDRKYMNLQEMK